MSVETIIFDLDGTLLDTTEGVLESALYAANKMGFDQLPRDIMLKFVGPPIQDSFIAHYGCDIEEAQKAANYFREYYKTKALLKAIPYEEIYQLCEMINHMGKVMAVATYKREDYAINILKHFGFDKYCSVMHGADNNNILSKADIVDLCISETGGTKESTVLIGDTCYDAVGAEKSGIKFIAVTYGFGFKPSDEITYSNIGVADNVMDILQFID